MSRSGIAARPSPAHAKAAQAFSSASSSSRLVWHLSASSEMADAKDVAGADLKTQGRKSGFDKPSDYFSSLKTPKLLAKRAFFVRSPEEQMADKEAAPGDMKKVLNWFHVMALGTGACSRTQQQ